MSEFWKTAISQVRPDEIRVRGYALEDLVRNKSFGDVTYLLLTGELPVGRQGDMVQAMLVACCEHSLASPSVDAVRFVASAGVPLQTAVAAGVSAIGEAHGGAIEPCAHLLHAAVAQGKEQGQLLRELKAAKRRLPGYGHPLHKNDPRVKVLLALAQEWAIAGAHVAYAHQVEDAAVEVYGRPLNMNVDGIIAAIMCDMGIDPGLGKAFFIIGRAPGYVAHAHEQATMERPFKAPSYDEITYTGPAPRDLPEAEPNQGTP